MSTLGDLGEAFRKAVRNFKAELHRDDVPDTVDKLLHGMREELIDARSYISRLEDEVRKTLELAAREGREVEACRRREALAMKVPDEETAALAREYATRHERRQEVLERKALALKEELEVRRSEADEMVDAIKSARSRRDELAATMGRASTRESIRGADDLFSELDRMAEKISDSERRNAATEELLADDPLASAPDTSAFDALERDFDALERRDPSPEEVDAALQELKRRMRERE
jgi:phage shock protein A